MTEREYRRVHRKINLDWKDPEIDQFGPLIGGGIVICWRAHMRVILETL